MLAPAPAAESLGGSAVAGNRRDTREALCASAVRLAERAGYRGAGTLEYLYDEDTGEFFFIEMNTRIQVEHPITEMISGIDLVREMIRIAQGEPLGLSQAEVQMRGRSIEVRINAEDPDKNFRPSPGKVGALALPAGPGVRVDTMLYPGYAVPAYYDFLLAKIIVHAETRDWHWRGCAGRSTSSQSRVCHNRRAAQTACPPGRSAGGAFRYRIFGATAGGTAVGDLIALDYGEGTEGQRYA